MESCLILLRPANALATRGHPLFLPAMKRFLKWCLILVLLLLVLVMLALWLVVPPVAKNMIAKKGSEALGRPVAVETIQINPFGMKTRLEGLTIGGDSETDPNWIELAGATLNPDLLQSILQRRAIIETVHLDQPLIRLQRSEDGSLNLTRLVPAGTNTTNEVAAVEKEVKAETNHVASLPDLEFKDIAIHQARFEYQDDQVGFNKVVEVMNLSVRDFRTTQTNTVHVDVKTVEQETFVVDGTFCIAPLQAELQLDLNGVTIEKYRPWFKDILVPELFGKATIKAKLLVNQEADQPIVVRIEDGSFALADFRLAAEPPVEYPALHIDGVSVDLLKQELIIGSIKGDGMRGGVVQTENDGLNVMQWFNLPQTAPAASNAVVEISEPSELDPSAKPSWKIVLQELELKDHQFTYTDEALATTVPLALELSGKNLGNHGEMGVADFLAKLGDNQGELKVKAEVEGESGTGKANFNLSGLGLGIAQPWIDPHANVEIKEGTVSFSGDIDFVDMLATAGKATLKAKAGLGGWTITGDEEPLFSWNEIDVGEIDFAYPAMDWSVAGIRLDGVDVHLGRDADGVFNLSKISTKPAAEKEAEPVASNTVAKVEAPEPKKKPPTPYGKSSRGRIKAAEARAETVEVAKQEKVAEAKASAEAKANAAAAKEAQGPGLQLFIDSIQLANCQLHYVDETVDPPLKTQIEDVDVSLTEFNLGRESNFDFTFDGSVQYGAPIEASGRYDASISKVFPNIKLMIKNIYLEPVRGISGKYIGREIVGGAVSIKHELVVEPDLLRGEFKFLFDHIKMGEKVDSPDAIKAPIGLALFALGKQGKVDEEIKIEGNPNDPQFRIGSMIWRAILNLVAKIVGAPVTMASDAVGGLAGVVVPGGKAVELSYIDFEDGSAELSSKTKAALDTLAVTLKDKPFMDLRLALPGKHDSNLLEGTAGERILAVRRYMAETHGLKRTRVLGMPAGILDKKQKLPSEQNRFRTHIERLDRE